MFAFSNILADLTSPLRLEHLSIPAAALLFAVLSLPVIWLGVRSLNWLGPTRKWVAISLRLSLIWVFVLLLCGAEWVRENRDLEVIVLRDTSTSTSSVNPPRGKTLTTAVDDFIRNDCKTKRPGDRIGVVGFAHDARIEALPDDRLHLDSHPIPANTDGTDIASALRLGLASFRQDAMRRLVLVSDGNATQGNTDGAIAAAAAMRIPIDVLPLHYQIRRDVLMDRLTAPTSKHVGEPFTLDAILRSTSVAPVMGMLTVTENNQSLGSSHIQLHAGANVFHISVPLTNHAGLADFRATFVPDNTFDDALPGNDTAEAFTFLQGAQQVLYVDGEPASAGRVFASAIESRGWQLNHIQPSQFPTRLLDLEAFDAIILSDVPRGANGLSAQQDQILAQYVTELGGGLLMIGGPESFGPGNWHGSAVEKILPVDCDIPAERVLPAGAIVVVIDHSGSMSDPMSGSSELSKQQVASDAAILAINALQKDDLVGVVGFSEHPEWVVPLAPNLDPEGSASRIRAMRSTEGTNICPALEQACAALERISPEQAGVKRILLLTDGVSEAGDYDRLLSGLAKSQIQLSAIAVGNDADASLLRSLAMRGHGSMYTVSSPNELRQVFVREARMLRRQLIHEPAGGIDLVQDLDGLAMPKLSGMVLTALKPDPLIRVPIVAAGVHHDPILAEWNIGMGRAAVFTSDVTSRWASQWVASPSFAKFWSERIRETARPQQNDDFAMSLTRDGSTTHIVVESTDDNAVASNFVRFTGRLAGPDDTVSELAFTQTAPGRYEMTVDTFASGNYAACVSYFDAAGRTGTLLGGFCVPTSVELRDMQSNEAFLADIAARTNGRVLPPLDQGGSAGLFDRETLARSESLHSINDLLLCILMGMLVTDVAVRRLHWDWTAIKHYATVSLAAVQGFTTTRKIDAVPTLAALRQVHARSEQRPSRTMYFEPSGSSAAVNKTTAKAVTQSSLANLKAAKQRAMEEIRQKENRERA